MATLTHSKSTHKYSWWWDSHVSPKNSKWLKENLIDMDSKIKSMIKIIEEDADSFALRAEMYYQRRPELMSLVEEIYRAYRALAERYDHAIGALHQAHCSMADAFPDQVPLDFNDDDDVVDNADTYDNVPHFFNPADLQKNIEDFEILQKEVSRMSQEKEDLKSQIENAQAETRNLKDILSKLEVQKEAAVSQCKESGRKLNSSKSEESRTQDEYNNLKEVMLQGHSSAQERCEILESGNMSLQSELEGLKRRAREKKEVETLNVSLQSEKIQNMQCQMTCSSLEKKLKEICARMKVLCKMEKEMERIKEVRLKLGDHNLLTNSVVSPLKDEIMTGERWDGLERRYESLNFELETEKEKHSESEEKVKAMVGEIERVEEEKRILSMSFKLVHEKYSALERTNHSLNMELEKIKQKQKECEEKVNMENLSISLQEVQLPKVKFDTTKLSLGKALEESQERMVALSEENESLLREREKMKEKHRALSWSMKTGEERYNSLKGRSQFLSLELEELKKVNPEVERVRVHLQDVNLQKVQMQMKNIELERELERSKEEYSDLSLSLEAKEKQLNEKIGEFESVQKQLQEMQSQKMQEQTIHLSIAKQLVESQGRLNQSCLQKEKLNTEMERIRDVNKSLDEHNHLASSRIIGLQNEIISLSGMKTRLEDEITLHLKENRCALEELSRIKQDSSEHDSRHIFLTENIQTISSNVESLHKLTCELKHSNFELKEIIKNHEDVRTLHSDNLRQLKRISEMNALVEKSLSIGNAELEGLGWGKEELEMSSEYLRSNTEKLVERKNSLENSLCVANAEIKGLRKKLKELNASYQFLMCENEKLEAEKRSLVSEVQSTKVMLMELEKSYQELEVDHRNVQQDKALILDQVRHLEDMLSQEKLEAQSAKILLEAEQQRVVNSQNEIFKFQRSLNEANEMISKLNCVRNEKDKLVEGLRSVQDVLQLDDKYESLAELQEEIIIQIILRQVEKSFIIMLLEHFGREVHELRLDREHLKKENATKCGELHELRGDIEPLVSQLLDLQESCLPLQKEIGILSQKEKASQVDLITVLTESISKDIFVTVLKSTCQEMMGEENILLKKCGLQIENLLGNIKGANFNAALFKEKVELMLTWESFDISAMVQTEVLKDEISRRNLYVHELNEKLNNIEIENQRLKVDVDKGEMMILGTLKDEVAALELQTFSLLKDRLRVSNKEKKMTLSKCASNPHKPVTHNPELQELYTTIKFLQEVVADLAQVLEQEELVFAASLTDAKKQVDLLSRKEISNDDLSRVNYEQMLKDIQLDLVQSSNSSSSLWKNNLIVNATGSTICGKPQSFNVECWGLVGEERESGERNKLNVRLLMQRDMELEYPEIDPVLYKETDTWPSNDQMPEKELGVHKQIISREVGMAESHDEWKKNIIERLSSDSQRLVELQSGLNELKSNIGLSQARNGELTSRRMRRITAQLREVEGTILLLIKSNDKLSKKVDELDANLEEESGIDTVSKSQRKILDHTRKESEKIGRLEMKLQKVHHMLLKLEADSASALRESGVRRKSKVPFV